MSKEVEIEFEVRTPQGLQTIVKRMPWKITMASSIRREKNLIEKTEGYYVLHAFDSDVCLMRKYRIK
jgi:hypothetical protein